MAKKNDEGVGAPSKDYFYNIINDEQIYIVTTDAETTIYIDRYADALVTSLEIPYNIAREIVIEGIEKCSVLKEYFSFGKILQEKYHIEDIEIIDDIVGFLSCVLLVAKNNKQISTDDYFQCDVIFNEDNVIVSETIQRRENKLKDVYEHNIRTLQPGSGKTFTLLQKVNSNLEGKDLILGAEHSFFDEFEQKVSKDFVVLRGFKKACARYYEDSEEGKLIQKMYENKENGKKTIPNKAICMYMGCDCGYCEYREQFNKMKEKGVSVGAPIEFLHILDFDLFDNIYLEESILDRNFTLDWDINFIRRNFLKLKICDAKLRQNIFTSLNYKSQSLNIYADQLKKLIDNHNEYFAAQKGYKINKENFQGFLNLFCGINVDNLIFYLELQEKDKNKQLEVNGTFVIDYQMLLFYKQKRNKPIQYNCSRENLARDRFLDILKVWESIYTNYQGVVNIVKADLIFPILAGLLFPNFRYKVYSIFHKLFRNYWYIFPVFRPCFFLSFSL